MPMLDPDRTAVSTVAINGAAQVLRPPEDGLPYLRHDRAGEQRLDPGSLLIEGDGDRRLRGVRRGRRPDRRGRLRGDPGLRRLPHAPAVRRLARGRVRAQARRRVLRGDRARRRRDPLLGPRRWRESSDERGARAGPGAGRARCSRTAPRRSSARAATGCRRDGEVRSVRAGGRAARTRAAADPSTGAARPRGPRGLRPRRRGWTRSRGCSRTCSRPVTSARSTSTWRASRSRNDDLRRMGELAARARARPARARRAVQRQPLGAGRARAAGARSVDHLACLPADEVAAAGRSPRPPRCCSPAPSSSAASSPRPARALADAGAICVLGHRPATPAPRRSLSLPRGDRARRAPLRLVGARGAAGVDAERGLGAADCPTDRARSRSASAPTCVVLDGPIERIAYRFGRNPVAAAIVGGALAYVRAGLRRRSLAVITAEGIAARLAAWTASGSAEHGVDAAGLDATRTPRSRAWFEEQARRGGLRVARDPGRQPVGVPGVPSRRGGGVGSHLDSVRGGGRFDGAARRGLRRSRSRPPSTQPLAVISFADEEGARFNTPTFGSKALAGRLDVADGAGATRRRTACRWPTRCAAPASIPAASRRRAGVARAPARLRRAPHRPDTDVDRAGAPVGIVSALAARTAARGRAPRPRRPRRHDAAGASAATRWPPPRG